MVKHFQHVSPGRIYAAHHESDQGIAFCPVCNIQVIRWSNMDDESRRQYVAYFKVSPA